MKLNDVKKTINKWLFIDDEEWLDIIFACSLDRKILGEPIWLFVIAVPSGSKTEILRAFREGDDFFHISSLTANSFVSGFTYTEKNKKKKVEDLATQIDGKCLILKDFTSILSMAKEKRDEIIGQLRELYDGSYEKKFGNIDKKVRITSSFGLLAGVTPKIDKFHSIMGQLGERFLKLRSDFDDEKMLEMCDLNEGKEVKMRKEISDAVVAFYNSVKIKEVKFSSEDIKELKKTAQFIAKIRAPDYSRWEGDNCVEYIKTKAEKSPRVYKQIKKLCKSLCCIYDLDSPNELIMERVWRVAKDSSPPDRLLVWESALKRESVNQGMLTGETRIPKTSIGRIIRVLQDVELFEGIYSDVHTNEYWVNKNYIPLSCFSGTRSQENNRGYVPKIDLVPEEVKDG
jgi:hypothetical protein